MSASRRDLINYARANPRKRALINDDNGGFPYGTQLFSHRCDGRDARRIQKHERQKRQKRRDRSEQRRHSAASRKHLDRAYDRFFCRKSRNERGNDFTVVHTKRLKHRRKEIADMFQ